MFYERLCILFLMRSGRTRNVISACRTPLMPGYIWICIKRGLHFLMRVPCSLLQIEWLFLTRLNGAFLFVDIFLFFVLHMVFAEQYRIVEMIFFSVQCCLSEVVYFWNKTLSFSWVFDRLTWWPFVLILVSDWLVPSSFLLGGVGWGMSSSFSSVISSSNLTAAHFHLFLLFKFYVRFMSPKLV